MSARLMFAGSRGPLRYRKSGAAGFTLIELLVVMIILIVVLGAIYTVWFGLQRTYSYTEEDLTAQEQARRAMSEMVEFIRTARQPEDAPTEALNVVIYSADKNSIVFWTDADRDADHDLELVRFWVNTANKTLYRDTSDSGDTSFSTGAAVRLVTDCVTNDGDTPLFRFFRADGQEIPSPVGQPGLIREIRIDLKVDIYENNRPIAHELTSTVQPRNLRQY